MIYVLTTFMHGRMICDHMFTYLLVYMETRLCVADLILIIIMVIGVLVYLLRSTTIVGHD